MCWTMPFVSMTNVVRRATPLASSRMPLPRNLPLRVAQDGEVAPSCLANAMLAQMLSTLRPRMTVLVSLNLPALSRYRDISVVQPGENAAGNQARTTFCFPLNELSVTSSARLSTLGSRRREIGQREIGCRLAHLDGWRRRRRLRRRRGSGRLLHGEHEREGTN